MRHCYRTEEGARLQQDCASSDLYEGSIIADPFGLSLSLCRFPIFDLAFNVAVAPLGLVFSYITRLPMTV